MPDFDFTLRQSLCEVKLRYRTGCKRVAGVKSEVLVLGCVDEDDSVILLQPNKPVKNGLRVL